MRGRLYHRIYPPVDIATCLSSHQTSLPTMTTNESVSARIRAIRIAKGLSLSDVEKASHKKIKAVVLGSYERGDRNLSVSKAITIAEFYAVPLTYLLCEPVPENRLHSGVVVDLRNLRTIIDTKNSTISAPLRLVITFISGIVERRNDWNGEVLSLRAVDIAFMAMALGITDQAIKDLLDREELLITSRDDVN